MLDDAMALIGSSPRVWGTPSSIRFARQGWRFIPTGVGNAARPNTSAARTTVHPHGCGERSFRIMTPHGMIGSSPRVWGTRAGEVDDLVGDRFIPTGVGNATVPWAAAWGFSVHPHGCGERSNTTPAKPETFGSSPRVWGTRARSATAALRWPVHPHGCGERPRLMPCSDWPPGSSPRVWGTLTRGGVLTLPTRFIPTGVGNAQHSGRAHIGIAVHPHGCGERARQPSITTLNNGSSPRVWGTPSIRRWLAGGCRFIPTGVGNASFEGVFDRIGAVHPHGCGERPCAQGRPPPPGGSSPRVWGTPAKWSTATAMPRFIPTGVGNAHAQRSDRSAHPVHPHGCGERAGNEDVEQADPGSSPRVWGTRP